VRATKERRYDLYDNEECIGTYTVKELAAIFKRSTTTIRIYISDETVLDERYRIEAAMTDKQLREWDKLRIAVLRAHSRDKPGK